jgi:hypothetical protein
MGGVDGIWCKDPLWVSVDLSVVLVYFLSCNVFVCVCFTLACSYDINKKIPLKKKNKQTNKHVKTKINFDSPKVERNID